MGVIAAITSKTEKAEKKCRFMNSILLVFIPELIGNEYLYKRDSKNMHLMKSRFQIVKLFVLQSFVHDKD